MAAAADEDDAGQEGAQGIGADDETIAAVYDERWKRVADVRSDLEADVLEAEALWGSEETEEALQPLRNFLGTLRALLGEHVMRLRGGIHAADAQRGQEVRRRLLGAGEEDELENEMDLAIGRIEEFLRPHLEL